MTDVELDLLKASIDRIVVLETIGREVYAQVLFVFDEGETPDCFYLEMERGEEGAFTAVGSGGSSVLLGDLVSVRGVPE